jgi:hypothetical protein
VDTASIQKGGMINMPKKTSKTKIEEHIICPHCDKGLVVKIKEEILTPAVKAEKRRIVIVEKNQQQKLVEA